LEVSRSETRKSRHLKIRKKIHGTTERPRLCVYKSLHYIYAQLIDDDKGHTIVSCSSIDKDLRGKLKNHKNKDAAKAVGESLAEKAVAKNIKKAVFDRNGYPFHGKVKILADAAREKGLEF